MKFDKILSHPDNKDYFSLGWQLTNVCNYRCHYCLPYNHKGDQRAPSLEKCLNVVESFQSVFHKLGKKIYWILVGGEVTFIPHFTQLLEAISSKGDLVHFTTNASSRMVWWTQNISKIQDVNLSYHPQFADDDHFLMVAELVDQADCKSHIHVMADPKNFERSLRMLKVLNDRLVSTSLGFDEIYVSEQNSYNLSPYPYAEDFLKHLQNHQHSIQKEKILKYHSGKVLVQDEQAPVQTTYTYEIAQQKKNRFKGWNCTAGAEGAILSYDGRVYPSRCGIDSVGLEWQDYLRSYDPKMVRQCKIEYCQCGPDIMFSKWK